MKKIAYGVAGSAAAFPALALAQATGSSPQFSPQPYGLPQGTITQIITGILTFLLMAVGIIGIIGFAIAGILYLTAAGDEDRIKKAKNAMLYSIIGVIVAVAGYVALQAAQGLLGGTGSF